MARKLKVFRTPIGFHDAYVAAPSRKAALEAWGSDHDLFARGIAEEVTDPDLTRDPLSQPGIVLKKSRGDADAQFAALDDGAAKPGGKEHKAKKKRSPRPDRSTLDTAEAAINAARNRHEKERAALDAKIAELEKQRQQMLRGQDGELAKLETARERLDDRYRRALERWRAS